MGAAFKRPEDIINRALQHIRCAQISSRTDQNPNAFETNSCYDALRRAELRRNTWRFATRRCALVAFDTSTLLISPSTYASGTTYAAGAIVQYPANSGAYWISLVDANSGNTPGTPPTSGILPWDGYYGPLTVEPYTTSTSYHIGQLVYITPGDNTVTIYSSLVEGNMQAPKTVDVWSSMTQYVQGAVVSFNGVNYQSLVNYNINYEPDTSATQWTSTVTNPLVSNSWLTISATLKTNPIVYPLTSGPLSQSRTRNAYRLPAGHLREAPQAPKMGAVSYIGAPGGLQYNDWEFEGPYLISGTYVGIMYRFVADVQDVTAMDDLFCEGLAARIALETGPILRPSSFLDARDGITRRYKEIMGEAREVNAIELGAEEPPIDDWISARL